MNCPVIVPAAGSSTRCRTPHPKQFMPWGGQPSMLEATVKALQKAPCVGSVIVVLPAEVPEHCHLPPECQQVLGGPSRAHSVLLGLEALHHTHHQWVMVHDAARPTIDPEDIMNLWSQCKADPVGGILTYPIPDTLKAKGVPPHTINREDHVLALTPQMFRITLLHQTLKHMLEQGLTPTDEAQVMEHIGAHYHMVTATHYPRKITWPGDLT